MLFVLKFPVIIVKNPGIGFTIEGGVDSENLSNDTLDTVSD